MTLVIPILSGVLTVFWAWMVLDFFSRRVFEDEEPWAMVVFFTPVGALIYFFGYYLPSLQDSPSRNREREFNALKSRNENDLPPDSLRTLGNYYRDQEQWANALRCYQKAATWLKNQDSLQLEIAKCLIELKRLQEAIPLLRQISELDEFYREEGALLLSQCLGQTNNWTGALQALDGSYRSGESLEADYTYAECLMHNQRREEARQTLERIVATVPLAKGDDRYWIAQARHLLKQL